MIVLFKPDRFTFYISDDDEDPGERTARKSDAATSRQTVIEMAVPVKAVGTVIGRQGATIKQVTNM